MCDAREEQKRPREIGRVKGEGEIYKDAGESKKKERENDGSHDEARRTGREVLRYKHAVVNLSNGRDTRRGCKGGSEALKKRRRIKARDAL